MNSPPRTDYLRADPGPPAYRLGQEVYYGTIHFGSGPCFVTGLRLDPVIADDDHGGLTVFGAHWQYHLTRPSGREWGWCRAAEVCPMSEAQAKGYIDPPSSSIHDEPHVPAEASGSCGGGCHLCPADPAEGIETAELVIPPPMIDPTDRLTIGHDGKPVYESEMPF